MNKNMIILRTDGGICSQIAFFALGKYLEDKYINTNAGGGILKYDITWFEQHGLDCDGIQARNYDIDKAFPDIKIQIATQKEILYYKRKYKAKTLDINTFKPPMYIDMYPERYTSIIKYKDFLKEKFKPIDINLIKKEISYMDTQIYNCGVHVRRGDLLNYNIHYGSPPSVQYFIKSIKHISSIYDNVTYHFFSDDMEWTVNNIIKNLDSKYKSIVYNQNKSDKGYLDLYLLSQCNLIISSQGSFGTMAKILSKKNLEFIAPKYNQIFQYFDKVTLLPEKETIPLGIAPKIKNTSLKNIIKNIRNKITMWHYKFWQNKAIKYGLILFKSP